MRTFTLSIDIDDADGSAFSYDEQQELSDLLWGVRGDVAAGMSSGYVRSADGEAVGHWSIGEALYDVHGNRVYEIVE